MIVKRHTPLQGQHLKASSVPGEGEEEGLFMGRDCRLDIVVEEAFLAGHAECLVRGTW